MNNEENDFNFGEKAEQRKYDLFINQVKEKLKELGMPQYELAEKIGISKQTMSQFIKGNRSFPLSRIKQIAEILHIDTVSVLNNQETFKENVMFVKLAFAILSSGDMQSGIISTLGIKKDDVPNIPDKTTISFTDESGYKTLYDLLVFGYTLYNSYIKLSPEQVSLLNHFIEIEHIISQT